MSSMLLSELWLEFKRTKSFVDSMREKLTSNDFVQILGEDKRYQIEKLRMLQKMDDTKRRLSKTRKKRKEKLKKASKKLHKLQKRLKKQREERVQSEKIAKKRQELLAMRAAIKSENYFSLVPGVHIDESALRDAVSKIQTWDSGDEAICLKCFHLASDFCPAYLHERSKSQPVIREEYGLLNEASRMKIHELDGRLHSLQQELELRPIDFRELVLEQKRLQLSTQSRILNEKREKFSSLKESLAQAQTRIMELAKLWLTLREARPKLAPFCARFLLLAQSLYEI